MGMCSLADTVGAEQVDYITRNGWTPCLEFSEAENAYIKDNFTGAQTSARARSCFGMRAPGFGQRLVHSSITRFGRPCSCRRACY